MPEGPVTWIAGLAILPMRDAALIGRIGELAAMAGLPPMRLTLERSAPAGFGSAPDEHGEPVVEEEFAFGNEAIGPAVADPAVRALTLRGTAPKWFLRLPLESGFVRGVAETLVPDERPALNLLLAVFNMFLVEWGRAGPAELVRSTIVRASLPAPTDSVRAPGIATVNYFSPDLLPDLDGGRARAIEGIRRFRAGAGGAVFVAPEDVGRAALSAALEPLLTPWPRPPIDIYPWGNGGKLFMRDASPQLAARQAAMAARVATFAGIDPGDRAAWTIDALTQLDAALLARRDGLTAELVEAWSAFAGEVAVRHGGVWRRLLEPRTVFPNTMIVVLNNRMPFQAHSMLCAHLDDPKQPTLAVALKDIVQQA